MFRAVSEIVSCWVNAASGIAGESKVGSTFGLLSRRKWQWEDKNINYNICTL